MNPELWVAGANVFVTIAIAAFAYVTVRHTKRSSRMERVSRALEELYSLLYANLQGRGHLYGIMSGGGGRLRDRHMEDPIDLWGDIVQPFMLKYRHLASKELQASYDEVDRIDPSDEAEVEGDDPAVKRFEELVEADYEKLVSEMNALAGKSRRGGT